MAVKHKVTHVMSHQTGYRVKIHELATGKHVHTGPWVVTGAYSPLVFNHEEDAAEEAGESSAQETVEVANKTS